MPLHPFLSVNFILPICRSSKQKTKSIRWLNVKMVLYCSRSLLLWLIHFRHEKEIQFVCKYNQIEVLVCAKFLFVGYSPTEWNDMKRLDVDLMHLLSTWMYLENYYLLKKIINFQAKESRFIMDNNTVGTHMKYDFLFDDLKRHYLHRFFKNRIILSPLGIIHKTRTHFVRQNASSKIV